MTKMIDLTGQRFGRLTVVKRAVNTKNGKAQWVCKCDCGNYNVVQSYDLRSGNTKSCGCLNAERLKAGINVKHGMCYTPLNNVWRAMKRRCYYKKDSRYESYGARGVTVCMEWLNDFQAFYDWAMANGYQEGLSIDRIDVNGNYEPGNCRWATDKEQANNTRNNHFLTYNGETHTIAEWAEIVGMKRDTLKKRIYYGWPIEKALTEPVKQSNADKAVNK